MPLLFFGPPLFLAYIIDTWKNTESTIRLLADECIMYRKIMGINDVENLQIDLNRLGEWALENEMIINPAKSKAVCFTKTE
jgi:hypothetical protein